MKPKIAIIAAVAPGGIIGSENRMPWYIPRDLKNFRRITSGHPVIMGRKTFESLRSRALPNRKNIVITRDLNYKAFNCEVTHSLEEAIEISINTDRIFIIGGGQLYAAAIQFADEIYLTQIENQNHTGTLFDSFWGDTFFPEINELEWKIVHRGRPFVAASKILHSNLKKHTGLYLRYLKYVRTSKEKK
ncbi:MAG: dihydrofolate reductase [Nitrosospira sp.]|nr:dihydrofolate reductase [Nitrosospira sp.]MDW7643077.1 dihydrofolate reductase [Nitrosomonadaceae bacterium]MBI0407371.1 dihydrofolate reductase [Nitrosospira sp.]MBI0414377.1 dihydrofolate reductase [Nitrosospira sp.]MBI0416980.1 dihydrofolate reductase [Nitrosospira sp.]